MPARRKSWTPRRLAASVHVLSRKLRRFRTARLELETAELAIAVGGGALVGSERCGFSAARSAAGDRGSGIPFAAGAGSRFRLRV